MRRMLITVGTPVLQERGKVTRWSAALTGGGSNFPESVWFEVSTEWAYMLTERADPVVIALVIPALRAGFDLAVNGPVTDELVFQHPELQAVYAECGFGDPRSVVFRDAVPAADRGGNVLAGFSGGIDSFAMVGEYLAGDTPERLRLTHLLFNNVGSHATGAEELWQRRYRRLLPTVEELGLPFIAVNSNLDQIPGSDDYQVVNSPANASIGHLLGGSGGTWVFSSSVEYRRVSASKDVYNSAFVDPMALPLMSTAAMQLRLSRSDLRRIDKARVVAEIPQAWASLDVCIHEGKVGVPNCSQCWKCQMTLAAFDLLGVTNRFETVFDLDLWRADREEYLAVARYTTKPALVAELGELMDEVGYLVPPHLRAAGRARVTFSRVRGRTAPVRSRVQRALGLAP